MRRLVCLAALAAVAAALVLAPAAWAQPGGDLNCSHFATQEAPQAILDAHPAGLDIYGLDPDGDGVACEALGGGALEDGTAASVPATAQQQQQQQYQAPAAGAQATATATTGAAPLPGTGGPPLLIPAAAALVVVSGVLGLLAVARLARRSS